MGEPLAAFIDMAPELRSAEPILWLMVFVMATIPLQSRRQGWRTVARARIDDPHRQRSWAFSGDRQFLPLPARMLKIGLAPVAGTLNLFAVAAIGWLLYRLPAKGPPQQRR